MKYFGVSLLAVIGLIDVSCAHAATLLVGADQPLKLPSDASMAAKSGDTVEIEPGLYEDCAVWAQNDLTITGTAPNVVIETKTCAGKGIFVIDGNNVTVKNLTLKGARVSDGNGAGIRSEGTNLTVNAVHFIENENGILINTAANSTVDISDSEFLANGSCANGAGCAHGIYAGHIALLKVANSKFLGTREGHHIKSRALRTELTGNEIRDGNVGTASYLVEISNGGNVLIQNNRLEKGPLCTNHGAAIVIGAEGVKQPTNDLIIKDNDFTNDYAAPVVFVKNITATTAVLSGNRFTGKVLAADGDSEVH